MRIDDLPTDQMPADEPSWTLVVADTGGMLIRQISLLDRTKLTIGRGSERDLILSDPKVSRMHCILYMERGTWCVVDAESSGGTFVDGQRVLWKRLHEQRAVQVGDMKMWIRQSPLPMIDPALNRQQSSADNTDWESTAGASSFPSDTIVGVARCDDEDPLCLARDAATPTDMVHDVNDDEAGLERTSVFLCDAEDFVDVLLPYRQADQ